MKWTARAPANIALVKYMGKRDARLNLPANASLSMTLDSLCTVVELADGATATRWVPTAPGVSVPGRELRVPALDAAGIAKFERHLARVLEQAPGLLQEYGLAVCEVGALEIRSANTFPTASGIASSASAFAALTLAGAAACALDASAFKAALGRAELRRGLARISRQGSGSSCRSFEGAWVRWSEGDAAVVDARLAPLVDLVLLVASGQKAVSSTDAHAAVATSPLWTGRVGRADARVVEIAQALSDGDLSAVARVAWAELWEMHSLFHTSAQPFSYWLPLSLEILQWLKPDAENGRAIVTMDAGPNVHLLVPAPEAAAWRARVAARFPGLAVLEDRAGSGAELIS